MIQRGNGINHSHFLTIGTAKNKETNQLFFTYNIFLKLFNKVDLDIG